MSSYLDFLKSPPRQLDEETASLYSNDSFADSKWAELYLKDTTLGPRLGVLDAQPQNSRLLALPKEVQYRIYSHVFQRWSMALLRRDELVEHTRIDDTFFFKRVGPVLIAGPPGSNLLRVCRALYNEVNERFGEDCTGTLLLGKIKGKTRRILPAYLASRRVVKRFYDQITRVFLYFSLNPGHLTMDFRTFFPNLKFADCLVHEGEYGPLVRHNGNSQTYLLGLHDDDTRDWTKPIVYHLLSSERRWIRAVHNTSCPFDDPETVVNVRVLGTVLSQPDVILGMQYRWEGSNTRVIARIARDATTVKYWEEGMKEKAYRAIDISKDTSRIPDRFRWVRPLKW